MESFPAVPCRQYKSMRDEIRSGDILLCSGSSIFSSLIQRATNSVWSHVAFLLRVDAIDRIMVLESVESIGVRAVPLSNYLHDYNGTGKGYPGRLMLARHSDVKEENIYKLSRHATAFLGYPYRQEEIVHIAARLSMHNLGFPDGVPDCENQRAFICSEYAQACFRSIDVHIDYNPIGFIAPSDFANHYKVEHLCYIEPDVRARSVA